MSALRSRSREQRVVKWGLLLIAILTAALMSGGRDGALAQRASDPPTPSAPPASGAAMPRATQEEVARRARTRARFAGQTAAEALATARAQHAAVMRRPVGRLLRLPDGVELDKWLGDRSALVVKGKRRAIVASTLPLRTRNAGGYPAPVDLGLIDRGDHLASKMPLVDVKIAKDIGAGASFPAGFSVVPLVGHATAARVHEGKVFWPEVLRDTDAIVMPVPDGIETFAQLRSAHAPEELRMRVKLPAGATLRASKTGGAVIERNGQALASISAPVAADAERRTVPVEMKVSGSDLVLRVNHVDEDVAYPVMVDPTITSNTAPFPGWVVGPSTGSFYATQGDFGSGPRLYILSDDWSVPGYAQWRLTVPRQSYIEQAQFWDLSLGGGCTVLGLMDSASNWRAYDDVCASYYTRASITILGNSATNTATYYGVSDDGHGDAFGDPAYWEGGTSQSIRGVTLSYTDADAPTGTLTVPAGWIRSGAVQVTGNDPGVGVKSLRLRNGTGTTLQLWTHPCTGEASSFCPGSWTTSYDVATLSEGRTALDVQVTDLKGTVAPSPAQDVRIDRVAPTYSWTTPVPRFVDAPVKARVSAQDGSATGGAAAERSGVKHVEMTIGGRTDAQLNGIQKVTQACATHSCPLIADLDVDPTGLAEGDHAWTLAAADQAGNSGTQAAPTGSGTITVDRTAPSVTLSGGLWNARGTTLAAGDHDLTIQATDPSPAGTTHPTSGITSLEVLVDGVRMLYTPQTCTAGGCSLTDIYTFASDGFIPGAHTIEVVAQDALGHRSATSFVVTSPTVNSDTARFAGLEEFFQYRTLPTGAGTQAYVNMANGNVVWQHRPISDPGRGLSTNVSVTYNSLASRDDLGHGYGDIGDGFSLSISTLTRVNEAMDVRVADSQGLITLTDADGTMHKFTRQADGTFRPPPGVDLRLRKFYASPTTADQRERVWAATRPDGVTYFFDRCGYQRWIQDRTGNKMKFEYDPVPPSSGDCFPNTHALHAKLVRVIDASGVDGTLPAAERTLSLEYSPSPSVGYARQITRITDRSGRKLEFRYRPDGRLQYLVEAVGTAQQRQFGFEYEISGRDKDMTVLRDPLGRATTFEYYDDNSGNANQSPHFGLGERVKTVTDRAAKITSFAFASTATERTADVTDRRQQLWKYRLDTYARPTQMTDPLGTVDLYAWDGDNNLAQTTHAYLSADEAVTRATYNHNGLPLTITDGINRTTTFQYRNTSGVTALQSPAVAETTGDWVSDLEKVTTPRLHATTYTLEADNSGLVRARTDAAGFRTQWDYTTTGLVKEQRKETEKDVFAKTTYADFDPSGLAQTITDARGNATADLTDGIWYLRYDRAGNLLDVTDPRGSVRPTATVKEPYTTEYDYDALHRMTTSRSPVLSAAATPRWAVRSRTYDLNGNVKTVTDATNAVTTNTYTAMDEVETVTSPPVPHEDGTTGSEVTKFEYDGERNVAKRINPKGLLPNAPADSYTTTWTYDAVGRPTVQRRRSRTGVASEDKDLVTSWAYDRRDNVVGVVDPLRNVTGDPLLNAADPLKRRWTYVYNDADERLTAREDEAGKNLVTTYAYDADGNLQSVTDPRGHGGDAATFEKYTTHYTYDGRSMLTQVTDPKDRVTSYVVRGDGLTTAHTTPRGNKTAAIDDYTTKLAYDGMGALTSRTVPWAADAYYPNTWKVTYTRDEIGDARTITDARGNSFTNTYFDTGHLATTGRPGFWTYDEAGGVRERQPGDPRTGDPEKSSTGKQAVGDFGRVDPEAIPEIMPKAGSTSFDYDLEMRLTKVTDVANHSTVVERDALGRTSRVTRPFDSLSSPARQVIERYLYDHHGNVGAAFDGEDVKRTFVRDQFDRLAQEVAPGSSTPSETTTYTLDENGNVRRLKTPAGPEWVRDYDSVDRLIKVTSPASLHAGSGTTKAVEVTEFDYDKAGNRNFVLPPRGHSATSPTTRLADHEKYAQFLSFNEANELVTHEAGRNVAGGARVTTFTYDDDGNQTEVRAPGSQPSSTVTTPQTRITKRSFDPRGLPWVETTGSGTNKRSVATEFDGNGNLRRRVNAAGVLRTIPEKPRNADPWTAPTASSTWNEHAVVFDYDQADLLLGQYLPWGRKDTKDSERWRTEIVRDDRGRIQTVYAPYLVGASKAKASTYTHYDNGWVKTSTDNSADPHTIRYDYDRRGNQKLWSSEGKSRRVERDFFPNALLKERKGYENNTLSQQYTYTYNQNRSLLSMVDQARTTPRTTQYTYDELERQVRANETWAQSRDTKLDYDPNGNVKVRHTDGQFDGTSYVGGKTTTFDFDEQDRELRMHVTQSGETLTRTIDTTWWPSDDVATKKRTRSDGTARVVEKRYFLDDGRPSRIARERRSNTDTLLETLAEQVYSYDDAANDGTDHTKWGNGNRSVDERGTHTFNSRDQLRTWTPTGASTAVTYDTDGSGAIKSITSGTSSKVFTYVGERLEKVEDKTGTAVDKTTTYGYNAFGNLTTITPSTGTATAYDYDGFERLRKVTKGSAVTEYEHDALDRRDLRRKNGTTFDFVYVGSTEALSREGIVGGSKTYDYDARLNPTGQTRKSGTTALKYSGFRSDSNGNVLGLENAAGSTAVEGSTTQKNEYHYDPYGQLRTGAGIPTMGADGTENPVRFQGFYYEGDTEAYDMQARQYRPDLARFLTADRYEAAGADMALQLDPLTNNRYVFVGGNPVDRVEDDGHDKYDGFHRYEGGLANEAGHGHCNKCGNEIKKRPNQVSTATYVWQSGGTYHTSSGVTLTAGGAAYRSSTKYQPHESFIEQAVGMHWKANPADSPTGGSQCLSPAIGGGCAIFQKNTSAQNMNAILGVVKAVDTISTFTGVGGLAKAGLKQCVKRCGKLISGKSDDAGRSGATHADETASCPMPGNSFVAGTPVLMADGSMRPIQAIRVGDVVAATDPLSRQMKPARVTATIHGAGTKRLALVTVGGSATLATENHPYWSESAQDWVDAGRLDAGDLVLRADGTRAVVGGVKLFSSAGRRVYNLTVEGVHTYYAGRAPVLVHNADVWGADCTVVGAGHPDGVADDAVIVRGGTGEMPPPGEVFSGAAGRDLDEAASGVPYGTVRQTTAGDIRRGGGSVVHKPEPSRTGVMNNLHVNVCYGAGSCPFSGMMPSPVPRKQRIP